MKPLASLAIAGGLLLFAAVLAPEGGGGDRGPTAHVTRIVDGDTIDVAIGARAETVRYIGVDTPESRAPGTAPQCYAKAAHAFNRELVEDETVRLEFDVERRDRYGRLLAYVRRDRDGLLVNSELVKDGYARTLTIPPNVARAALLAGLQRAARTAGRGLWGACGSGA